MHKLNHFIFSPTLCLVLLELNIMNLLYIIFFTIIFACSIDYDHHPWILKKLKLTKPWYHTRTWIQEVGGFILLGLPIAFLLRSLNSVFFILVIIPYLSHIFLDYLCIYEAYPLAPFSEIKKPEGYGIFTGRSFLWFGSPNEEKWKEKVKSKKMRAFSENYFLIINLAFFLGVLIHKIYP